MGNYPFGPLSFAKKGGLKVFFFIVLHSNINISHWALSTRPSARDAHLLTHCESYSFTNNFTAFPMSNEVLISWLRLLRDPFHPTPDNDVVAKKMASGLKNKNRLETKARRGQRLATRLECSDSLSNLWNVEGRKSSQGGARSVPNQYPLGGIMPVM